MKVINIAFMLETDSPWGLKFHIHHGGYLQREFITMKELLEEYGDREVEKIHLEDSSTVMLILR